MTFAIIILNVVLCIAVTVAVVAPLVWAIITQHHHETVAVVTTDGTRQAPAPPARRRRRGVQEPIVWPAH